MKRATAAAPANVLREERDVYALLQDKARYLQIVHSLALAMLQKTSLDDLLWLIAQSTISQLGFEDCVIYLRDPNRRVLVQRAAYGPKSPSGQTILDAIEIALGEGIVGSVALHGEAELIADVRADPRYIVDDKMRRSELAVPIVNEGQVIGVIDSEDVREGFYTEEHVEILTTISSMASTKIASALTIEKLNETVLELERTRNALRVEEKRYRDLYNGHPSMFFSVDASGCIISTNEYAREQLGFEAPAIDGMSFNALFNSNNGDSIEAEIDACLGNLHQVRRFEGSMRSANGVVRWFRVTARGLQFKGQSTPSVLIVAEDISDTYTLSKELEFHATHDWLTGLYNRREFERQVANALKLDQEDGSHALCYLDLDEFKVVNDTCGHAAGDALLRHVATCFEQHVRRSDVVARLGGDEFGVLLKNTSLADAQRLATQLLDALGNEKFSWSGRVFPLAASVGIAELGAGIDTIDAAFSAADNACLAAKALGTNCVQVFRKRERLSGARRGEKRWVSRINQALSEDAFVLHYQTIEPLDDAPARATHAELLLRMVDFDGTLISPDSFIPTAERFQLAGRIDDWVVARAFALLSARIGARVPQLWSINLSGPSVGDRHFLRTVVEQLENTGIEPSRICFEITETAAISNFVRARHFIDELRSMGCRFALDDFGIGFSSLAYLKRLPADFVKIDGMFISDLANDPIARAMVKSINDICHLMGKETIAECVQTEDVLVLLREMGVDYAQGHHVAEPRALN